MTLKKLFIATSFLAFSSSCFAWAFHPASIYNKSAQPITVTLRAQCTETNWFEHWHHYEYQTIIVRPGSSKPLITNYHGVRHDGLPTPTTEAQKCNIESVSVKTNGSTYSLKQGSSTYLQSGMPLTLYYSNAATSNNESSGKVVASITDSTDDIILDMGN